MAIKRRRKKNNGKRIIMAIILTILALLLLVLILGLAGSKSEPKLLNTGEVLSLQVYDDYEPKRVVIKAKIGQLWTNEKTIEQNYHNIAQLAKNGKNNDYLIDYWAVTETKDYPEYKVISFEVPSQIMKALAAQTILPEQLEPYLQNLWIAPGLR